MPHGPCASVKGTDGMQFRRDIEGLRFFAVVPIVIFHLDPKLCPGGFMGVDIFFVISGFLISNLILADGHSFLFSRFYYRRFWRLFPALLATTSLCLAAGWKILSPEDYRAAAFSAIPALAGVSNFYFYASVDYFNDTNLIHPLLHTWSLGVEEQFYLLWPALLLLASRRPKAIWLLLAATFGISFLSALYVLRTDPFLVFYMTPFRMFEFAIGAGALILQRSFGASSTVRLVSGLLGLCALFFALAHVDIETPWPGMWSLAPTLGTGLLLYGGAHPALSVVLGNPLFRYIGRISYSLYLVHWPVIIFYRYWLITPPTYRELIGLGALSIAIAAAMYAFVEKPFRVTTKKANGIATLPRFPFAVRSRQLLERFRFPVIVVAGTSTVIAAVAVIATNGFPQRLDRGKVSIVDHGLSYAGDSCSYRRTRCAFGDKAATRTVYLIGDSHALNLVYGLDQIFKEHGIKGVALYDHGCLFVTGAQRYIDGTPDMACTSNIAEALSVARGNADAVILAGNYLGYRNGIGELGSQSPLKLDPEQYIAWLKLKFEATLSEIGAKNRPVIIFKQTYSTGINIVRCMTSPMRAGDGEDSPCKPAPAAQAFERTRLADAMIDSLAEKAPGLLILDPKEAFCVGEECRVMDADHVYFRDSDHLTNEGSEFLMKKIGPALLKYLLPGDAVAGAKR
jgi:peptidoglycan/LPS O-acetylase OafA/YrhL